MGGVHDARVGHRATLQVGTWSRSRPRGLGKANEAPDKGKKRCRAPLKAARRAHAKEDTHQQSEIEAAGVNQQPLPNVRVAAEVHAAHAAGLIQMREGPF